VNEDTARLSLKIERLEALLAVTKAMVTQHDLDKLLDIIAHEAANIVGAERASIFLVTSDRRALTSKIAIGMEETGLAFSIDAGIAGYVARTGEVIVSDDPYGDERFNPRIDEETGFKTFNLATVPMYGTDEKKPGPLGVFEVLNKKDGDFSEEDLEILLALSGQAAVAIENARLLAELRLAQDKLDRENTRLRQRFLKEYAFENIIGIAPAMTELLSLASRVAESTANILITGESGTGKDLLARAIHGRSPRAEGPFVALNCAALPESLLEAELFGIEKGVATGVEERDGKIAQAAGGTLFLDEIGDMSLATQSKVLRVLQEREFTRVGGSETVRVDIRVIAATNKDLKAEIEAERFREDLFYRLDVVELCLPSLRERREDIPLLAEHFLEVYRLKSEKDIKGMSQEAHDVLVSYTWPGNVRELQNEIERAVALAKPGETIGQEILSEKVRAAAPSPLRPMADAVRALETGLIARALKESEGNKAAAAKLLGLSREGLRKKMARYEIKL